MHKFLYYIAAVGLVLLAGLVYVPAAQAELIEFQATINAEVQEYVAGEPGSIDSSFEEYGATSNTLPLAATARLAPAEETAAKDFLALGFADFRDPTESPERNPGEFGLEADVYSGEPEQSFKSSVHAIEERQVVFTREDLDIRENETERPVLSSVFVSGALVLWTEQTDRDLDGLVAELRIIVEREAPDQEPEILLEATLTAEGTTGGDIRIASPDGIFALAGGPELISATAGFTQGQLLGELAGLGRTHLIIIPGQELPYIYQAAPEIEYTLKATFEAVSSNLPEGTGVAAVYGRTFENLAGMISGLSDTQTKGIATQSAVNAAIRNARVEPDAASTTNGRVLCGTIGFGTLAMTLGLLLVAGRLRRTW